MNLHGEALVYTMKVGYSVLGSKYPIGSINSLEHFEGEHEQTKNQLQKFAETYDISVYEALRTCSDQFGELKPTQKMLDTKEMLSRLNDEEEELSKMTEKEIQDQKENEPQILAAKNLVENIKKIFDLKSMEAQISIQMTANSNESQKEDDRPLQNYLQDPQEESTLLHQLPFKDPDKKKDPGEHDTGNKKGVHQNPN